MKKILLLAIFAIFVGHIKLAVAEQRCEDIEKDYICKGMGCGWSTLGTCIGCDANSYGTGGTCLSCDTLVDDKNNKGYWNKSDGDDTPKIASVCYADCNAKKNTTDCPYYGKVDGGYCKVSSEEKVYYNATTKSKCSYSLRCDSNHYMVYNGSGYTCPACSSLQITIDGKTYTNYWTSGQGGTFDSNSCVATCGSDSAKLVGVATYEESTVTYPKECIPKTCQNSTNKCEGYKLVTPHSCPSGKHVCSYTLRSPTGGPSTTFYRCVNSALSFDECRTSSIDATEGKTGCFRYTQEQTTGFPEGTNATKGYTILNETSGTYPSSSLRVYECSAGYHLQTPVKTDNDHCTGRKYGTCISDTGKCNADLLDCTGGSTNTISGTNITWNADKEDWNANTGCKCVSTGVTLYNGTGNEIGTATITKTYASGDKNNGNTKWNDAEINVTRCILGYAAQDGTCKPVKDGQYSADNDPVAHECSNVEVCLQNGGVCSNPVTNYYKHSNLPRESADNCYAKCSERVADLNAKSGNNGTWRLQSGAATTVTRKIGSLCQVELSCKAQYYRYARLDMSVEAQKCKSCSELTDSDSKTDYWNKSDGGTGDETSCYALCNDSDKKPTTDNGKFTAGASRVNYDATTKAKCTYTLGCDAGYYKKGDGKSCGACPAGSTSDAGSTDIKQCYMKGGKDGTLFCDKHGCFNLPTGVPIFYAGD